ncbi:Glutamate racemase [Candidatus Desulfarcum epimagneticum]|uniref:Glutamate racemase n=1 Tax=uncultured Desulfobacteraceae bacterium TaxID=218296 RepID=A0A484HL64_9BACT|nr:Glutamate racemase [uncultured Desulfobacteraceae bacterium]
MIGIFDSGIGGLTVARAVKQTLPRRDIIYLGDTARTPYGNKTAKTVVKYALENTEFLMRQGAKIIVMACNTASSVAFEAVREEFDAPVFEVISPAVEAALEASRKGAIGVIGTRATIRSGVYEKMIKARLPDAGVHSAPCPLLVPLVEEGWLKKPETAMIVKKYLHPLKTRQIDTLILGCTHYPVLKDLIQRKIGKRVRVIDSAESSARSIARTLEENPDLAARLGKNGTLRVCVSDLTEQFKKTARGLLKMNVSFETV